MSGKTTLPLPALEILLGAAVFLADYIAIELTRVPSGIALLWPGCAIGACALIRLPRLHLGRSAVTLFIAVLLVNLVAAHRPWGISAAFSLLNLAELGLMVAAFRYFLVYPYPDLNVTQAAVMTALLGIAIPGVCAVAGAWLIAALYGRPFPEAAQQFWSSHAAGACMLGPPLILAGWDRWRRLVSKPFLRENLYTVVLCLLGTYGLIRYVHFPFASIAMLLLIASFRLGGFGTSVLSLIVGLEICNLWIMGVRPVGLDQFPDTGTLVGLPTIALLATLMPAIAVGIGTDSRRAVSRALSASERRFREAMAHSPVGMLLADLNGKWTHSNAALQRMLGYTEEELRALPPGGPSDAEHWRTSESRVSPLLAGEISSYEVERRFQHKDGHWIWTHVAVSLLKDEQDKPQHLIAQIESLEVRRQVEANLAAERERLNVTLQAIRDAVITTDSSLNILYVNVAAEALLGIPAHVAHGRRIDSVIHLVDPDTLKAAPNLIRQSAHQAASVRREKPCLLHRADGSISYVRDAISPVLSAAGLLSGLVIVLHDATADVDRTRDLQERATHDPLTGLVNRAEFEHRMRDRMARGKLLGGHAALLAIDLDRFKLVNDGGGHAAGDAMLRKVATVCRLQLRSSDVAARLGGDEFALLLDNCPEEHARRIGEKLLKSLNSLVLEWQGTSYSIGASLGLAMMENHLSSHKEWVEAADAACYLAKRRGRGRLEVAATAASDHDRTGGA
jgi:diguanylate cyclase